MDSMLPNPTKLYPNLAEYLNYLERRRSIRTNITPKSVIGVAFGGVAVAVGLAIATALPLIALAALPFVVAGGVAAADRRRKPPTPREIRQQEAQEVGLRFGMMMRRRRLHRDLDQTSLTILDECSRQWARAHRALRDERWAGDALPAQYFTIRDQARGSVDDAMDDVMLLYRDLVPHQVDSRNPMDYVEEAIETFVLKESNIQAAPPAAWEAQRVADKLRSMAEEAERISHDLSLDAAPPVVVGGSLDAVLGELRTIRQAEDELRQNLKS